jgi:hypothetical protein
MDSWFTYPWKALRSNDRVAVYRGDQLLYKATVDEKTHDSSVIWVLPDDGTRRLLHIDDGISIRLQRPENQEFGPASEIDLCGPEH